MKLDKTFWTRFAQSNWERRPLHVKNLAEPILNETQVFTLVTRYSDLCRKNAHANGFKLYVEGARLHDDETLELLPRKQDVSLAGYHSRMNARFPDYCLVCDELLQVIGEHEGPLVNFLSALYARVGLPNRFSEIGLYLGNYRKTPFGVHVDGCGVFSFPVVGKKRFRLWTEAYGRKNPSLDRSFEYAKHKKHSLLIEAGPSDMTYWPSSAWHIAESDGKFSATWSLGVWVDRTHEEIATETMNELWLKKLGGLAGSPTVPFHRLHGTDGEVGALPALYEKSIQLLIEVSEQEIREAFVKRWLRQVSGRALKPAPRTGTVPKITRATPLCLRNPAAPILWRDSEAGTKRYFSWAGILTESSRSPEFLKLIRALNAGRVVTPGKTDDLKCLQALAAAGAIQFIT